MASDTLLLLGLEFDFGASEEGADAFEFPRRGRVVQVGPLGVLEQRGDLGAILGKQTDRQTSPRPFRHGSVFDQEADHLCIAAV